MNTKITFVELVDMMAETTSTSKRVCELFLRELFATVSQALIDGESVKIKGVGTFKVTRVKSRKSSEDSSGKTATSQDHSKLTFTPDKALAEALNQPFAQFETVYLDDAVTDEKLAKIDKEYPSLFPDEEMMPEPPEDMPEPPAPTLDDIPLSMGMQMPTIPVHAKAEAVARTSEPKPVSKTTEPLDAAQDSAAEAETTDNASIEEEHTERTEVTTPLMGRPIDHPEEEPEEKEQPAPEEESEPDDGFYRPEPRNAYTPTPEQIEKYKKPDYKRWMWIALGVLAVAGICFLLPRLGGGSATEPEELIAEADTVAAVEEPEIITDTVTSKIVLSTLSDKYYGSPWFWVYIYEENRSIISDPNNVRPGTAVVIPPAEKYGIDAKDPASLKKAQNLSWKILKGK